MATKPKNKNPGRKPADDDQDDDEDEGGDDAPLTRGDLQKMVASTVTGMLGRKLGPAIESAMKPILERLPAPAAKDDDEGDDDEGDDDVDDPPARGAKGKGKPDPAYAQLLKSNEKIKKQLAEAKEEREKEKRARESATIDTTLTEHLTKLGVDPHRMRGALAVHRGFASLGEDGRVKYKVQRDGYDEDVAPELGLKEWGDTDEGKSYLAATGATGGSGSRAPTVGVTRKPAPNTPEAKAQRHQEARQQLATGVAELLGGGVVAIE